MTTQSLDRQLAAALAGKAPGVAVVIVDREEVRAVTAAARAREAKEAKTRADLAAGKLGLDIYGMREKLKEKGLRYL